MTTITTRAGKGSPLTNAEVDANFTGLNSDKAELSGADFTGDISVSGDIALGNTDHIQWASTSARIEGNTSGADYLKFYTNNTENLSITGSAGGSVVVNEGSSNLDFRVESTNNANMLFVDAGNDRVGVGTNAPAGIGLTVNGGTSVGAYFYGGTNNRRQLTFTSFDTASLDAGHEITASSVSGRLLLSASSVNHLQIDAVSNTTVFNENSTDQDFRVESNGESSMLTVDAGNDRVGVGTNAPQERLTVKDGDILIDNNQDSTLYLGKGAEGVDGVTKIKSYQSGTDSDELGLALFVHPSSTGSANASEAVRISHQHQVDIIGNNQTDGATLVLREANNNTSDTLGTIFFGNNSANNLANITSFTSDSSTLSKIKFNVTQAGGVEREALNLSDSENVFNDGSINMDFRVESNNKGNMFFVDAGNDRIGVNTSSPSDALVHVANDIDSASYRDVNSIIYNLNGSITEAQSREMFRITADATRRSCQVRITFQAHSTGGISNMSGGSMTCSIWKADGDVAVKVEEIHNGSESSGSVSMLTPTVSGDIVTFGMRAGNNGTSSTYTVNTRIELVSHTPSDFTVADYSAANATASGTHYNGGFLLAALDGSDELAFNKAGNRTLVVNEDGYDRDFRVESDSNTHALFVDAGNDRVGVLTSSPAAPLDIQFGDNANILRGSYASSEDNFFLELDSAIVTSGVVGYQFHLTNNGTAYNNTLTLDRGNVGVGVQSADAKLHVSSSSAVVGLLESTGSSAARLYFDNTGMSTAGDAQIWSQNNDLVLNASGAERLRLKSSEVVVNEDSADVDFRVESDSNDNAIFLDAGTNRVGFFTSNTDTSTNYSNNLCGNVALGTYSESVSTIAASGTANIDIPYSRLSRAIYEFAFFGYQDGGAAQVGCVVHVYVMTNPNDREINVISNRSVTVAASTSGSNLRLTLTNTSGTFSIDAGRYVMRRMC